MFDYYVYCNESEIESEATRYMYIIRGFDIYEEQQNKSRSCPTRGVDQNLSFRLGISGASERVRIAGLKKSRKLKIYSRKDLGQFKKCECELVAFLKARALLSQAPPSCEQ